MINKENGEVIFPDWGFTFSPQTTRSEFLNSPLALKAKVEIINEPYTSWRIQASYWQEKWWTTIIRFNGERLGNIILSVWDNETGPQWKNWSEEKERALQKYHTAILTEYLGSSPYKFSWGIVESFYDKRSAGSYIRVEYSEI